jgi:hypothetical protein
MYHVDSETFRAFLANQNFDLEGYIPKPDALPCIIEFRRAEVIKAKVEVKSYNEFVDVVKRGKSISHPDNKYWIRGNEWKKDASGNFIKEMFY